MGGCTIFTLFERKKINKKYLAAGGKGVIVPIEDCYLVDKCAFSTQQVIAVLKDGEFLFLLEDCKKITTEIYCALDDISILSYTSPEQAVSDLKYSEILRKNVRVIDGIAYNNWCDKHR